VSSDHGLYMRIQRTVRLIIDGDVPRPQDPRQDGPQGCPDRLYVSMGYEPCIVDVILWYTNF
jgi:hypothetical protein